MARKKSASTQETAEEAAELKDENKDDPQTEQQNENSPENSDTCESQADHGDDSGSNADAPELTTTGEIAIEEEFHDDTVLNRLRSNLLTSSELYREAQIFSAQNLNIPAILQSGEPVLIQNILEILRIVEQWYTEATDLVVDDDPRTRELAGQYLLNAMRNLTAPSVDVVDEIIELNKSDDEDRKKIIGTIIEKLRPVLLNLIAKKLGDVESQQTALTHLCACLDTQTIERMLCDPDTNIRTAIIRSLGSRDDIELNTFSLVLILLKDRCDQVNIAIMKLCEKICRYPELVVPQILPLLPSAGAELHDAIIDVFRAYGNTAIEPLMTALEDTGENMFSAASAVIASAPQRFTSVLIDALQSSRTRDFVRERIADILSKHKDPPRTDEIQLALQLYNAPAPNKYPQWVPPQKKQNMHAERATDNDAFYERILSDDEIKEFSKTCNEENILRLMADASEFAQINAMKVIADRKEASAVAKENIAVWMKSSSVDLAEIAVDTWFSVNPNYDASIPEVIDVLLRAGMPEIQKYILEKIAASQPAVDAVFKLYYEHPKRCIHIVNYILKHKQTKKTLKNLLRGLDRNQSVACISETLQALDKNDRILDFDRKSIYGDLIRHMKDPVSFGQFGLIVRLKSLDLLKKYLTSEKTHDQDVISSLQAMCKECKNSELREKIKNLLRDLGEEIFDFEDEDDDFEDLNDDF